MHTNRITLTHPPHHYHTLTTSPSNPHTLTTSPSHPNHITLTPSPHHSQTLTTSPSHPHHITHTQPSPHHPHTLSTSPTPNPLHITLTLSYLTFTPSPHYPHTSSIPVSSMFLSVEQCPIDKLSVPSEGHDRTNKDSPKVEGVPNKLH